MLDAKVEARFLKMVRKTDTCWLWTGFVDRDGYGMFKLLSPTRRMYAVHRVAHMLWIGPIPEGLEVDHVRERGCTNRSCVNPAHLEAVTHAENVRRGRGAEVARSRKYRFNCLDCGVALTSENTHKVRNSSRCRDCACRVALAAYHARKGPVAPTYASRTACKYGHPYTPETPIGAYGQRRCLQCERRAAKERREKRRASQTTQKEPTP